MTGTQPSRQLAGVVLYASKLQRYLVLERSPQWYQGWGLIQGGIESGESATQAGVREVQEEVGVPLNVQQLIDLNYSHTYLNSLTQCYCQVQWFAVMLEHEPVLMVQADEWLAYQWLPYQQALEKLVWADQREVLQRAQSFFKVK